MTIVMPVFFVIVNVSIVSSVSIFNSVEQVSVSCNASFARNVSIVCNCEQSKHCQYSKFFETPGHLAREMCIFEPAKTRCVLRLSTKEHFMTDDFDNMIRAIRTTFKDENFQNRFAFEDEVNNSLQMLVEKHRVDTGSIQEALCSKIPAREILLEEIQHWISVIKKRLSPRMKAHNAWTIEFKRDIPSQVFRLILKAVQKARSAFGVSCTETR